MDHSKYDLVDVTITSQKPIVDAILEHPILDSTKKYSIEVTEFTTPLTNETPMPLVKMFNTYEETLYLFRIRRRNVGETLGTDTLKLTTLGGGGADSLGEKFQNLKYGEELTFRPNEFIPIHTPNDLVFALQQYLDEIKQVYILDDGITAADHGNGNDVTKADLEAEHSWVRVVLSPNGTIRLYMSPIFCNHFFLECSDYSKKIFGLDDNVIAFRLDGNVLTGNVALTQQAVGGDVVPALMTQTAALQGKYPLTRHFDHRIRLELDSSGMPVPAVISWSTDNKQQIRHNLATFPINMKHESSLTINTVGADEGNISIKSDMLLGDLIFRRAENKISERYQILNAQFFQNIRLEAFIVRKEWSHATTAFEFKRRALTLLDGETWTAKLRFRTFK